MSLKPSDRSLKVHRPDVCPTANVSRGQSGKRRSTRMSLNANVGLTGHDRQKLSFTMPARATNLNKHGAAVQLHRELQIGSTITVRNQRGALVSARVVAQLATLQGIPTYAIEFIEQNEKVKGFWGITFPTS